MSKPDPMPWVGGKGRFTFTSHRQLLSDLEQWEPNLPVVDAFVGVPRSGIIPAAWLALRRNVRLITLDKLMKDPVNCIANTPLRDNNPAMKKRLKPIKGQVMIVDDCCSIQGNTITDLRKKLAKSPLKIHYAAVYRAEDNGLLDFWYRDIPQPRMFEWNFFRHWNMHSTMWDMDGAICEDWRGKKEKFAPQEYLKHLGNAKPLYIPEHPIYAVVTNRLPKWRPQTRSWLQRHDVPYQHLMMSPHQSIEEREHEKPLGISKGKMFKECQEAHLFVESDSRQAEVIAQYSGKPVLAIDQMKVF